MNAVDQILRYVGQIVLIGGGGAAVAYALFRYLGKSWIESRFAERLASFKHAQALEIQHLRVQIESMLSGALKLQELEFKVLPEAWKRLDESLGLVQWIAASVQQYPSIDGMSDPELEEALTTLKLTESQKAKIRASSGLDRREVFQKQVRWQRLHRARVAGAELQSYLASNGLFLPPPLKQQFSEITTIIWSAMTMVETSQKFDDFKMRAGAADEFRTKGEPLRAAIEKGIEDRLHSHAVEK